MTREKGLPDCGAAGAKSLKIVYLGNGKWSRVELKCWGLKLGRNDQLVKGLEWWVKGFELYPVGNRMGHLNEPAFLLSP